jgi:hypothetical protein
MHFSPFSFLPSLSFAAPQALASEPAKADKDVDAVSGSLQELRISSSHSGPVAVKVESKPKMPIKLSGISNDILRTIGQFACHDEESYLTFILTCKSFHQAQDKKIFQGNSTLASAYLHQWKEKRKHNQRGDSGGKSIPREIQRFIQESAPTLRSFTYTRGMEMLPASMEQKITQFQNLETISFSGSFDPSFLRFLADATRPGAAHPLQSLRELNIACWGGYIDTVLPLDQIAAISTLQILRLVDTDLQADTPTQLAKLENLTFLDLSQSTIKGANSLGDAVAPILPQLRHLQTLNLFNTRLKNTGLGLIANAVHLTSLNVGYCTSLTVGNCASLSDEAVCSLAKLPLREINLSGTAITNRSVKECLGTMKLTTLDLRTCKNISPGFLNDLQHIACLEVLKIARTTHDDKMLCGIDRAINLTHLDISEVENIAGACLQDIAKLKQLRALSIRDTQINDDRLQILQTVPTLTSLDLSGLPISDMGVQKICTLPHLQELLLSRTDLTDKGLQAVAALPQLSKLSLLFCDKITDTGLFELAHAHLLVSLDVTMCKNITKKDTEKLTELRQGKFMPHCKIIQS